MIKNGYKIQYRELELSVCKVYQKKINVTILWEILNLNQSDVYFLLISFGL